MTKTTRLKGIYAQPQLSMWLTNHVGKTFSGISKADYVRRNAFRVRRVAYLQYWKRSRRARRQLHLRSHYFAVEQTQSI